MCFRFFVQLLVSEFTIGNRAVRVRAFCVMVVKHNKNRFEFLAIDLFLESEESEEKPLISVRKRYTHEAQRFHS